MVPVDEAEGRRKQARGQALRLAWTQKIDAATEGAGAGDVTTGAVSWSRGEPGYYIAYIAHFLLM